MTSGPKRIRRAARWAVRKIWPNQRLLWTRVGIVYGLVWVVLLVTGLNQQINLILLVAGLAAGPAVASIGISAGMIRKVRVARRPPAYAFSGEPITIDYAIDNDRKYHAALALVLSDELVPEDRSIADGTGLYPRVFVPRVAGRGRGRIRWEGVAPARGSYRFKTLELATRMPFGLFERRLSIDQPGTVTVYPSIGQLTRRWHYVRREASEVRRGSRHDRSVQQQEYQGLRDYRPGDSPRWVHWRTSARLGQLMVKEFEQQHEQDLTILVDPWMPRARALAGQREAVEQAIRFAATICFETCRQTGRRLFLGWTGDAPGVRQGPASVKLLHDLLEHLATLRANADGRFADLLDVVPAQTLRESLIIIVSTRAINLTEESERSIRMSATSARGLLSKVLLVDVSKGEHRALIQDRGAGKDAPLGSIADRSHDVGLPSLIDDDRPILLGEAPDAFPTP